MLLIDNPKKKTQQKPCRILTAKGQFTYLVMI